MFQAAPWENDPIVGQPRRPAPSRPPMLGQQPAPTTAPRPWIPAPPEQQQGQALQNAHTALENQNLPITAAAQAANAARARQEVQQGNTRGVNFTDENTLRQQYRSDPRVQGYEAVLPLYRAAQSAADTPAGDYNVVTAFAKITDPSTGIRQGESQNVESAASPGQSIEGLWNFYTQGRGRLTAETRSQLMAELSRRGAAWDRMYNTVRADIRNDAQRYGFDPHAIVGTHAAIPFRQEMGIGASAAAQAPAQPHGPIEFGRAQAPLPPGAAQFQSDLQAALGSGAFRTPDDIIAFGRARGFDIDQAQATAAIRAGRAAVAVPQFADQAPPPDISSQRGGSPDAANRHMFENSVSQGVPLLGAAVSMDQAARGPEAANAMLHGGQDWSSLGLRDEAGAGIDTLAGNGSYSQNIANQRGIDAYDRQNHFGDRLGGQLITGLPEAFLPGGVPAQMARGGAQGALYGFGSGEGGAAQRLPNAVAGGVIGAAAPPLLAGAGRAVRATVAPRLGRPAADLIAAADRQSIPMLPADTGGPMTRRATAAAAQTLLGAGPIVRGAQRTITAAGAARDRVAQGIGSAVDPEAAGQLASQGAQSFIGRTSNRGGQLYSRAEGLAGNAQITPTNAVAALDRNIAELGQTPGGAEGLSTLQSLRQELNGSFSVSAIRRMRSALRDRFASSGLRGSDLERRVNQVVDAANDDVVAGLQQQGNAPAARAYQLADRYWRNRIQTIDQVLEPIVGNNQSGEQIVQNIQRAARGNTARLEGFLRALPDEEGNVVRATLISQLGRPSAGTATGETFSLNQFLTHWNQMTPRARQVMFGPEANAALSDVAKVAQGARQAGTYANRSNTGGVVGNLATGGSAAFGLPTLAAILGTQYGAGRLLASPAFARWLSGAARAGSPSAARTQIGRLSGIAARNPAISQEILGLRQTMLRAVNDNMTRVPAAASPSNENQQ
jgi:hypothetical protein